MAWTVRESQDEFPQGEPKNHLSNDKSTKRCHNHSLHAIEPLSYIIEIEAHILAFNMSKSVIFDDYPCCLLVLLTLEGQPDVML
jgi:hypothetical protein